MGIPVGRVPGFCCRVVWLALPLLAMASASAGVDEARIVSVRRIWDHGAHNAFTDLTRYQGRWLCVFREAGAHVSGDGRARVIESTDGEAWTPAALIAEEGVDLRDPKLSLTPDGRLMMVLGGSVMRDGKYVTRQPRVTFSRNGRDWEPVIRVIEPGHWLWRVTWHQGRAYGISYLGGGGTNEKRAAFLYASDNATDWSLVTPIDLPDASETTLRFGPDGEMIALSVGVHARGPNPARSTGIGISLPPYREWTWRRIPYFLGGPNFMILPDGRWVAGSRRRSEGNPAKMETVLAWMTRDRFQPFLAFPSGGDTSYPGLVWHEGELWVSYYSSHEGKAMIYLARVSLPAGN